MLFCAAGIVGPKAPAPPRDALLSRVKVPPEAARIVVAERKEPFAPWSESVDKLPAPAGPTTSTKVDAFVPVAALKPPLSTVEPV